MKGILHTMKKTKKLLSILLSICILMTTLPIVALADTIPSDWAAPEVALAENVNLVTDKVKEDYQKEITREEFCELVVRLYTAITGNIPNTANTNFIDVNNDEISKAYGLGIVYGVTDTEFVPDAYITRQEICAMLVRCIDKAIPNANVNNYPTITAFQVSDWAQANVFYAIDNDIMKGVYAGLWNNLICPQENTTREQAVLMNWRVFDNKDNLADAGTSSGIKTIGMSNDVVKSVTVDYTVSGNNSSVQIYDASEYDYGILNTAGRVGNPVGITAINGHCVDATITFEYDDSQLVSDEKNLGIAYYDEIEGRMVLTDSKVDPANNKISVQTDHFSHWVMVDELLWYDEWSKDQLEVRDKDSTSFVSYDVVLAIDRSGSMDDNDPESLRKTAAYNFIKSLYDEDEFSVISFAESNSVVIPMTKVADIVNWGEIQESISNIGNSGGTNITSALTESVQILDATEGDSEKMIILLTDGQQDVDKNDDNETIDEAALELANEKGISIYTIGLGDDADEEALKHIASECNGEYYKAKNAKELISTYQNIKDEKIGISDVDDDNDGIADVIEVSGMRNQFGMILKSDPTKQDSDTDGLTDGREVGTLVRNYNVTEKDIENGVYAYVYYRMSSDPTAIDSDKDDIKDPDDDQPWINNKNQPISNENITLYLNGNQLYFTEEIGVRDNKVYVPLNDLLDEIGAQYLFAWDDNKASAGIIAGGIESIISNPLIVEQSEETINVEKYKDALLTVGVITPMYVKTYYRDLTINGKKHEMTDDIIVESFKDKGIAKVYVTLDVLSQITGAACTYYPDKNTVDIQSQIYFDDSQKKKDIYNAFSKKNFDVNQYQYAWKEINDQTFWESYLNDEAYNFAYCFEGLENLVKALFVTVIKDKYIDALVPTVTGGRYISSHTVTNWKDFIIDYADNFYYYDTTLDYKDAIIDMMSELDEEEFEKKEVPDYIKNTVKGLKQANTFYKDDILEDQWKEYWKKRGRTSDLPEIGKDMRYKINKDYAATEKLGKALKGAGTMLKVVDFTEDTLEFLFTDYSNSVDYLYTLKYACGNNEAISVAVDEIIEQYTTDYVNRIISYGIQEGRDFALDKATGVITDLIPYYGLAKFATNIIAETAGWSDYEKNIDRVEAFNAINASMAIYYPAIASLCYSESSDELFTNMSEYEFRSELKDMYGASKNTSSSENAVYFDNMTYDELKELVWDELRSAFIVNKASMEKGYRIMYALEGYMPASDRDIIAQIRHSITLDELSRVHIVTDMPQYAKDAFYVK